MGNQVSAKKNHEMQTSYNFEIDNFSEKNDMINSPKFSSGLSEWYVTVYPKRYESDDHMYLFLSFHNPKLLRYGWNKRVNYCFSLLNQSGKVLYKTTEKSNMFFEQFPSWGHKTLPLNEIKKGFLEKNKLIIKVEVKVVEVIYLPVVHHPEKMTRDFNGFEIRLDRIFLMKKIFTKYPDIAQDIKVKDKAVKTAYMNLILDLINKLRKPPKSFSEDEISNAHSKLSELTEAGFKVDWLKTKLWKISLERKNAIAEGSEVEEMKERVKNLTLTLSNLKFDLKKKKKKAKSAAYAKFDDII